MLMIIYLSKFDICFKSNTNSWCPYFLQKNVLTFFSGLKFNLSDIKSFLPDNLSGLEEKLYSVLFSRYRNFPKNYFLNSDNSKEVCLFESKKYQFFGKFSIRTTLLGKTFFGEKWRNFSQVFWINFPDD